MLLKLHFAHILELVVPKLFHPHFLLLKREVVRAIHTERDPDLTDQLGVFLLASFVLPPLDFISAVEGESRIADGDSYLLLGGLVGKLEVFIILLL